MERWERILRSHPVISIMSGPLEYEINEPMGAVNGELV